MSSKEALVQKWKEIDPVKRIKIVQALLIVSVVGIAILAYYATDQKSKQPKEKPKVSLVSVGEGRLEDDVRSQVHKESQQTETHLANTDKATAQTADEVKALKDAQDHLQEQIEALKKSGGQLPNSGGSAPDWPASWAANGQTGSLPAPGNLPAATPPPPPPETTFVGDIGMGQAPAAPDDGKKKEGKNKFYLPVSFMSAKLLTGIKAKTVETARSDPEQMLFRVQAPAVLPNEIRAQLAGCFVVANGIGSLSSERVDTKLVTLSCLNFQNQSVIEVSIKGFVADKDGVRGLAGHVVSKAGANMARAMVAGAFAGVGQALSASSTTTSTSALGTTATIQPGEIGKAGLGQGLSSGANEMSKVFLDLVRQSAPVVEHGPDTDCTLVIVEGVWLEVKDYESQ